MSSIGQSIMEIVLAEIELNTEFRARMKKALGVEPAPTAAPEKVYMSIIEWAAHVGIGRSKAFEVAWDPTFPIVLSGRARRVDVQSAERWMRERFAQANARRAS
jgi:hypothetical protein